MSTTAEVANAAPCIFDVSRGGTRQWDERDAFISWLRGEFAAANAIIDALCHHLQALSSAPGEYDAVLACVHQRRYNWNPVLHMQQYYSVGEVLFSLQQVAAYRKQQVFPGADDETKVSSNEEEKLVVEESRAAEEELNVVVPNGSTANHVAGSKLGQDMAASSVNDAVEVIDGQQVNLLEGLVVHESVFDAKEASRIGALASESHASKKRNKCGGEKRSPKVKAKEVIHFGTIPSEIVASSSSEKSQEKAASAARTEERAEPMPAFLESIIDRLVTSQVVPASKRPDSCSISVLEPGDYMPPHKHNSFEQPIFILSLGSQSELTFGRNLKVKDLDEAPKCKVVLSVGSVLVLEGNSAGLVQCAVPPTQSTRMLVTFGRMAKKVMKTPSPAASTSPVSPTAQSFVPARFQTSPPAPMLVPVRPPPAQVLQSQPMIVASIGPYSPVTVVGPAWSAPTRVQSPGTGVFLPAKGASHAVYSSGPHQHMNGSHRRLAAAAAHHFENATTAPNGHVMAGKEVAA